MTTFDSILRMIQKDTKEEDRVMPAMKYIGDYFSLSHLFLVCMHPSVFEMDAFSLRKAFTPFE